MDDEEEEDQPDEHMEERQRQQPGGGAAARGGKTPAAAGAAAAAGGASDLPDGRERLQVAAPPGVEGCPQEHGPGAGFGGEELHVAEGQVHVAGREAGGHEAAVVSVELPEEERRGPVEVQRDGGQ